MTAPLVIARTAAQAAARAKAGWDNATGNDPTPPRRGRAVLLTVAVLTAPVLLFGVLPVVMMGLLIGGGTAAASDCGASLGAATAATVADVSLTGKQISIAQTLAARGSAAGLPDKGIVAELAAGWVESTYHNWASKSDPPSLTDPGTDGPPATNNGYGDNASLGVLQQQTDEPTMNNPTPGQTRAAWNGHYPNWGTHQQLMNPATAADLFIARLRTVLASSDDPAVLAQTVQQSASPTIYESALPMAAALFTKFTGRSWSPAAAGTTVNVAVGPWQTGTGSTQCSASTLDGAVVSGSARWILYFADLGWHVPYQNCPVECRSITGVHACYHAYTAACRLLREDCSGFVRWVMFNALHIDLGPDGNTQLHQGAAAKWPIQVTSNLQASWTTMNLQPGDVIFFGVGAGAAEYGNSTVSPDPAIAGTSHVGIYAGNGRIVENGGDSWQGYHPLYNQGVYQYVMRIPGLQPS